MLARRALLSIRCGNQFALRREMAGHGHGHDPYIVPDYKTYKVDNCRKVQVVQCALEKHGLSDPWARNEVWRYNLAEFGDHSMRVKAFMLRGTGIGLVLCIITIILENVLGIDYHGGHHEGGHDDHGHGGHH